MLGQRVNKFIQNERRKGSRDKFPITHNTIRRKKDVKAVSSKAQVPPLLRQPNNAALVYFKVLVSPSKQFEFETHGVWLSCAIKRF